MVRSREYFYDLHIHTSLHSPCSQLTPEDAIIEARDNGLDGIAFTEHSYIWTPKEIRELKERIGYPSFPVLIGSEISTQSEGVNTGDLLVFGAKEIPNKTCTIDEICRIVHQQQGVVIAAHPYVEIIGMGDEIKSARIDGIEIANYRYRNLSEIRNLENLCQEMNITPIASSDAHSHDQIGKYCVRLDQKINNEADLIRIIQEGKCHPCLKSPPGRLRRAIRRWL